MVFDLDGTVVANMPLHAEAFALFMSRHGLPPLDERQRARLDGKRNSDIFPELFGRALPAERLQALAAEKEALYRELSRGRLAAAPGLERLLALLAGRGIPVAIATSGPAENVRHTLAETRLAERLALVVRGDQVPRGKPHPDIFLAAAERIGAAPAECLAFEDSPSGVAAASSAGMRCVALLTSFTEQAFLEAGALAQAFVRDFDEFLDRHADAWEAEASR